MENNDTEAQTSLAPIKSDLEQMGGAGTPPQQRPTVGGAPAQADPTSNPIPFEFRGDAKEYFKIWVVNLALTLLTLGIYSPWAKVRKLRYFYGNTYLDGSSFEFLGKPIAILKGRIIAVLVFLGYWLTAHFYPLANLVLLPVLAVFMPWVMVKALAFRARNSAYRNLTFSYHGGYGQIAWAYLSLPLFVMVTIFTTMYFAGALPNSLGETPATLPPEAGIKLGMTFGFVILVSMIASPYFFYLQQRAYLAPRSFGDTGFAFDCGPKAFYGLFVKISLIGLLALIVGVLLIGIAMAVWKGLNLDADKRLGMLPILLIVLLLQLYLFVTFITLLRNRVLSALRIGETRLSSQLRIGDVFMLYITNIVAIVCTLGLLAPWAKVRLMRYQMENTSLLALQGTEYFTGGPGQSASAVGEEVAEVFDVDLSI